MSVEFQNPAQTRIEVGEQASSIAGEQIFSDVDHMRFYGGAVLGNVLTRAAALRDGVVDSARQLVDSVRVPTATEFAAYSSLGPAAFGASAIAPSQDRPISANQAPTGIIAAKKGHYYPPSQLAAAYRSIDRHRKNCLPKQMSINPYFKEGENDGSVSGPYATGWVTFSDNHTKQTFNVKYRQGKTFCWGYGYTRNGGIVTLDRNSVNLSKKGFTYSDPNSTQPRGTNTHKYITNLLPLFKNK